MDTILTGWLFDFQPGNDDEGSIWIIEDPGKSSEPLNLGRRLQLKLPVQKVFYASGQAEQLRSLWGFYKSSDIPIELSRSEQTVLGRSEPATLLGVKTAHGNWRADLFVPAFRDYPNLDFFNIDVPAYLHCAALYGALPLSKVKVRATRQGVVKSLQVVQPDVQGTASLPDLRVMVIEPDVNPARRAPRYLRVEIGREAFAFALQPERSLLIQLAALLRKHDPDLILTAWGDTWLLPYLISLSQRIGIDLPLSRDEKQPPQTIGSSYVFSQEHNLQGFISLAGRWHVDRCNSRLFAEADLESLVEVARLTGMPVPLASRSSAGMAVASMQGLAALRRGILIPYRRPVSQTASAEQGASAVTNAYLPPIGLYQSPGLLLDLLPQLLEDHSVLAEQASHIANRDARSASFRARLQAQEWILQAVFGRLGFWAFNQSAKGKHRGAKVGIQPQELLVCAENVSQEGRHEI